MNDAAQKRATKAVSPADAIKKLVMAHMRGDKQSFRSVATDFIKEERRRKHHSLADDLERLLSAEVGTPSRAETLTVLRPSLADVPRDKERGFPLLQMLEPSFAMSEMFLTDRVRAELDRILQEQRKRDLLQSYGLKPLRKLLFCGPPGCGKTMAAEALAKDLYLPIALVRFDAVISSYLGETAANLRRVFEFAASRPMVVFFDEFDAIGKRRDDVEEHGELKRVVNAFLQMLDNFTGETVTIAATNHERMLDPAIWRRFDEVVLFSPPSREQIEELLKRSLFQIGTSSSEIEDLSGELVGASYADVRRVADDTIKFTLLNSHYSGPDSALARAVMSQKYRAELTALKQS